MYKFYVGGCLDFDESIKAIESLKVEIGIKCLINTKEHFIYVQDEWEAKLIAKAFKEETIEFDCYFIKWQIKADFEESY